MAFSMKPQLRRAGALTTYDQLLILTLWHSCSTCAFNRRKALRFPIGNNIGPSNDGNFENYVIFLLGLLGKRFATSPAALL